jgi:hypothetical protein
MNAKKILEMLEDIIEDDVTLLNEKCKKSGKKCKKEEEDCDKDKGCEDEDDKDVEESVRIKELLDSLP